MGGRGAGSGKAKSTPKTNSVSPNEVFANMFNSNNISTFAMTESNKAAIINALQTISDPTVKQAFADMIANNQISFEKVYSQQAYWRTSQSKLVLGDKYFKAGGHLQATLTHELGHALDHYIGYAATGVMKAGNTHYISHQKFNNDLFNEGQAIYKGILNGTFKHTNGLKLSGVEYSHFQDTVNGATLGGVTTKWGHAKSYWKDNPNTKPATEAFANISAAIACNHTESLNLFKKYMPKTYANYLANVGKSSKKK